jgi:mannose-6-phosphate isomerase-like protein (cupin superfamily)
MLDSGNRNIPKFPDTLPSLERRTGLDSDKLRRKTSEAHNHECCGIGVPGTRLENPLDILGDQVLLKLGGRESVGQLTVTMGITPPNAGPPLHRHSREDESFYVLEGEYLFEVDGKQFHAGPGTSRPSDKDGRRTSN